MGRSNRKVILGGQLSSHLIRFIGYNIILSLLPLIVSITLRWLAKISAEPGAYTPELLFFSISVSATASGNIKEEKSQEGIKWLFDLLFIALLLSAIVAATLFGFYQYEAIVVPVSNNVRENMTSLSASLAVIVGAVSLIVEWVIAYTRKVK